MAAPDFWDDPQKGREIMQKVSTLNERVREFKEMQESLEELEIHLLVSEEDDDESAIPELRKGIDTFEKQLDKLEMEVLLSGPYDENNCIVSIHPGAGGTESQDWSSMLYRMYGRWVEKNGFIMEVLDYLPGDDAGLKSVTFLVKGSNSYGYLKAEKGVHRLVRISPFDSSGRRHTSFASVDVLPEVKEEDEIEIEEKDLKIDTYRAGGAGGQHVNKTDSAVRITHIPTGIVVQCQNERSQHSNRAAAIKILKARLLELKMKEREKELEKIRGEQKDIAWGSQIRSYVFHPYTMVKDHRTGVEVGNVEAVLDGAIDEFIYAYLQHNAEKGGSN
ncbi:MAG: peptide chain release factor 2 [Clostridia bacterium]|nr:peptide chain release factor 2 [Clostridia bacterium]